MWELMSLESGSLDKGLGGCRFSRPSLVPMPLRIEIKRSALPVFGLDVASM
jgi:hypothetical protein